MGGNMDVRNAAVEPIVEHGGTCKTFFLHEKESLREATMGSYLEFVCEFEIAAGERLEPHRHNTHEFYYILKGDAIMQIERDKRAMSPGDIVHIPPNAVHSIRPTGTDHPVRVLAFAASFLPPGGAGLDAEPVELPEAD
jgi:quercetin dioxygenase-like cupin family protein